MICSNTPEVVVCPGASLVLAACSRCGLEMWEQSFWHDCLVCAIQGRNTAGGVGFIQVICGCSESSGLCCWPGVHEACLCV